MRRSLALIVLLALVGAAGCAAPPSGTMPSGSLPSGSLPSGAAASGAQPSTDCPAPAARLIGSDPVRVTVFGTVHIRVAVERTDARVTSAELVVAKPDAGGPSADAQLATATLAEGAGEIDLAFHPNRPGRYPILFVDRYAAASHCGESPGPYGSVQVGTVVVTLVHPEPVNGSPVEPAP
ncbi:MAG TPA: hypothetical protein VGF84_15925 [Micromonosporaceae bacterium]|jgi:hypothetical protein